MEIRPPAVAGAFYPFNKEALLHQLEQLFAQIKGTSPDYAGVICPHAGYDFSGLTAAHAVSSLKPNQRLIILGPNHYLRGDAFALDRSVWATPLGECKPDTKLAKDLLASPILKEDRLAHEREHSIEVQLPLLQYRFKKFTFVPISIMNTDYSEAFLTKCQTLGKAIAKIAKTQPISVIASSDFSHFLPEKVAKEKDKKAIQQIKKLDPKGLFSALESINASVCGYGPIAVLLTMAAELKLKPKLIHSSNSGDVTGDSSSVVTYHAIGFK